MSAPARGVCRQTGLYNGIGWEYAGFTWACAENADYPDRLSDPDTYNTDSWTLTTTIR